MLGLETATVRQMLDILRRTYCGRIGIQFMHISDPDAEGLAPAAHRRRWTRRSPVHARGQERHPEQADRGRGLRAASAPCKFAGTKRFGLDGGEALIPALEQIIKARRQARRARDLVRHAPSRPPQRALQRR
jgi:2-oxoglutarate dehydrogenase E1 component